MFSGGRYLTLRLVVVVIFVIIILRLFHIQIVDSSYKEAADNNALRYEVQHPPRGEIYDRNGEFLAQSIASYDLLVTPRELSKDGFDTLTLCRIAGISKERLERELKRAANYSRRRASVIVKQMSIESKLLFDEGNYQGFHTVYRTQRSYPRKIAGSLLGYIGEVSESDIQRDPYYNSGDYKGFSGIESAYEELLRGVKGTKINIVDVHGAVKEPYKGGEYDTPISPGVALVSSIDAELQAFGEELMEGKVGSIVAIEPQTGEILMMVSSPGYDPDKLVGRERGNNYMELLNNPRRPLYNRAVMTRYPPGSTFKLVNGLIGLQEGVLVPSQLYPCHGGYTIGRGVKCHDHYSPLNLRAAVATSCNAYFCYVLRNILDNPKYGGVKNGFDKWEEYVRSFGFGRKLGSDFLSEYGGYVPDRDFYDRTYRGSWNSLTVISLAIGQGELGCSPLQMANLAAIVANRGYYYIPHVIKKIEGADSLDQKYYEKHFTLVDSKHFDSVIDGMYDAVNAPGGTGTVAAVAGLDICGKTGTAQNSQGKDHSTFLCFAPRNNPQIAISVYVENGGFGSTVAAPIAGMIVEKYLTGKVERQWLVDQIKNTRISYPHYDRNR